MIVLCIVALVATIGDVAFSLKIISAGRGKEGVFTTRLMMRIAPWLAYVSSLAFTVGGIIICFAVLHYYDAVRAYGCLTAIILFRLFCIGLNFKRWRKN